VFKYQKGDLFAAIRGVEGRIVIPHVCNDYGGWGAGFVIPLSRHYPQAEEAYRAWSKQKSFGRAMGQVQYVGILGTQVDVANMVAQHGSGHRYASSRPLDYAALARCMDDVGRFALAHYHNAPSIHCPMFGAGLAGGNWEFIRDLVDDCWIAVGLDVTVYHLDPLPKQLLADERAR
jgi:O-acetyl-ADP-ribose deacetylase (regulator of RNase III)